jgi:membrane protein
METMQRALSLFLIRRMADLRALIATLKVFPWRNTAHVLRERFREDRLGLTASSLTFTTTIALVPLFTVAPFLRLSLYLPKCKACCSSG